MRVAVEEDILILDALEILETKIDGISVYHLPIGITLFVDLILH